ncbi:MAG TPA: metallophosphoesterase [Candidatus Limnocylindria bacterium]|nr:metallophosphoesterase [Candidatus Limnocylindria bacterium]
MAVVGLAAGLLLSACGSAPGSAETSGSGSGQAVEPAAQSAQAAAATPTLRRSTLLVVGDVGDCGAGGDRGAASATLASTLPGPILLLGDIAYRDGTRANYDACFLPAWGPLASRTRAVIGNHDNRHRSVFYRQWPSSGTSARPWYSYRVGSWRVLVVDANCRPVSCSSGGPQTTWLRNTLASHRQQCTLLAMHQPRFSSDDEHGDDASVDALWRTAHAGGVDLVVAGHAHDYERIGPVGIAGRSRSAGPVLLVVGTGGAARRGFASITPASKKRINNTFGIARLTLGPSTWRSEFLAAPSGRMRDTASGSCR